MRDGTSDRDDDDDPGATEQPVPPVVAALAERIVASRSADSPKRSGNFARNLGLLGVMGQAEAHKTALRNASANVGAIQRNMARITQTGIAIGGAERTNAGSVPPPRFSTVSGDAAAMRRSTDRMDENIAQMAVSISSLATLAEATGEASDPTPLKPAVTSTPARR
jgi:hypothetical protein